MPSDIPKSCYFGLRKLNIIAICGKVQMFSQKYVIYEVYRYGLEEHIGYLELAIGILR
jgi:hypothetical protein